MTQREEPEKPVAAWKRVYPPGAEIGGRYLVEREMAAGGMAVVYQVRDLETGSRRALKTLNDKYARHSKIVERLVREFRSLQEIEHPGLVRVFDAGVEDGRFFYVMELLDGLTLKDIKRARRLPIGAVLSLMEQVCNGVHALHKASVVHRDLKPDNIFVLEAEGEPEHVTKILDLGVAKHTGLVTTSSGTTLGTVTYMSPEQTRGQVVDARADVYAICLMMFELLAGFHAMEGKSSPKTPEEWAERQRERVPESLIDLGLPVHPFVANLVQRGLQKEPVQRFASAADLAEQIRAARMILGGVGQLGSLRVDPFDPAKLYKKDSSGEQPIARILPPGVPAETSGVGYGPTDQAPPGAAAEKRTEALAPMRVSPEPPRVLAQPDQRTVRGTVKMLGRQGTKPHFQAPSPRPSSPESPVEKPLPPPPAPPAPSEETAHDTEPTPAPASPLIEGELTKLAEVTSDRSPRWRKVPVTPLYAIEETEPERKPVEDKASKPSTGRADRAMRVAFPITLGLLAATVATLTIVVSSRRSDPAPSARPTATLTADRAAQATTQPTPTAAPGPALAPADLPSTASTSTSTPNPAAPPKPRATTLPTHTTARPLAGPQPPASPTLAPAQTAPPPTATAQPTLNLPFKTPAPKAEEPIFPSHE